MDKKSAFDAVVKSLKNMVIEVVNNGINVIAVTSILQKGKRYHHLFFGKSIK